MPQKPVYSRPPLLTVPHCFASNGTIRTTDAGVALLYEKASQWVKEPYLWEGLFRLACLLKSKPTEEPVADLIYQGIQDTENGAMDGSVSVQVSKARAAFAVYEYNTDRSILKRIAVWLRYLEVEYEQLSLQDHLLYQPADLMELLIRFYQVTGIKSVLRLCAKVRATVFDWTSVLNTFQQSIPLRTHGGEVFLEELPPKPEDLDYGTKEKLINHAELLADGVRYSLFAGLFSGNRQELQSGEKIWSYLKKYHRAICGGTTSDPFLCGCASDQPVSNRTLSAWTEAFAAQMLLPDSGWALDELIRIVFNGLGDCLHRDTVSDMQYVNTTSDACIPSDNPEKLYARLSRATAVAFKQAVTLKKEGIMINYLIPARYLLLFNTQAVILHSDYQSARFLCKEAFSVPVDLYVSYTGTSRIMVFSEGKAERMDTGNKQKQSGFYLHTDTVWKNQEGFDLEPDGTIVSENTHHQGVCFFSANRLLCAESDKNRFDYVICSFPENDRGKISVRIASAGKWISGQNRPGDIPVLPSIADQPVQTDMKFYSETESRIAMFPKAGNICFS